MDRVPRLLFLALTAGVLRQQREAARAAGMDGFVAKPLGRGRLVAALQPWLQATTRGQPPSQEPDADTA